MPAAGTRTWRGRGRSLPAMHALFGTHGGLSTASPNDHSSSGLLVMKFNPAACASRSAYKFVWGK